MPNSQNFRSAFNGFNREDVVHYLEYINSRHSALVNQLSEEAEYLRQKLSVAAEAISSDASRAEQITALENERDELKQQLEEALRAAENADAARTSLEEECLSLRNQLDAVLAAPAADSGETENLRLRLVEEQDKCARLEAELQAKTAAVATVAMEKELEAYRRAERLERIARERADQVYRKTNGVLADATVKVDQVASDIGSIADQVVQQLQQLQLAVTGSKLILQEAAAALGAIRPTEE